MLIYNILIYNHLTQQNFLGFQKLAYIGNVCWARIGIKIKQCQIIKFWVALIVLYNIKTGFSTLATALIQKGDTVRALNTVEYFYNHMPRYNVKPDRFELSYPGIYYMLGKTKKGKALIEEQWKYNKAILNWASNEANREIVLSDIYECYQVARNLSQICSQVGETKLQAEITKAADEYKIRFGFPN